MRQNISYDDDEIELIKKDCANAIYDFGKQFHVMDKMYKSFGMYYPKECNTNFRDSWFHYRKLYTKKDAITVLNEEYGLEEHLLRAAKDAQIYFLQQLGGWLEVWYRCDEYLKFNSDEKKDYTELLDKFNESDKNWVLQLWTEYENDQKTFANLCLLYYERNIVNDELREKMQHLIHSIKNTILELRLGGVNIYRPLNNSYYMQQCINLYNDISKSLGKTKIKYLLSATDTIRHFCSKKYTEAGA